ncbi:hypothetical protein L0Y34_00805 [Candidatus Parcubacteria bacterium]|nr:hypothetical protein [Candidatus Parcubacteria bacterium]
MHFSAFHSDEFACVVAKAIAERHHSVYLLEGRNSPPGAYLLFSSDHLSGDAFHLVTPKRDVTLWHKGKELDDKATRYVALRPFLGRGCRFRREVKNLLDHLAVMQAFAG